VQSLLTLAQYHLLDAFNGGSVDRAQERAGDTSHGLIDGARAAFADLRIRLRAADVACSGADSSVQRLRAVGCRDLKILEFDGLRREAVDTVGCAKRRPGPTEQQTRRQKSRASSNLHGSLLGKPSESTAQDARQASPPTSRANFRGRARLAIRVKRVPALDEDARVG